MLLYAPHEGARPTIWLIGEIAVRAGRLVCAAEHVAGSVTKMQTGRLQIRKGEIV